MTDIIIQGIYGRMGRTLLEKIAARTDCRVVAGVDCKDGQVGEIPVFDSFEKLPCGGVLIDFSSPAGAVAAAAYGAAKQLPCVICSTGLIILPPSTRNPRASREKEPETGLQPACRPETPVM